MSEAVAQITFACPVSMVGDLSALYELLLFGLDGSYEPSATLSTLSISALRMCADALSDLAGVDSAFFCEDEDRDFLNRLLGERGDSTNFFTATNERDGGPSHGMEAQPA